MPAAAAARRAPRARSALRRALAAASRRTARGDAGGAGRRRCGACARLARRPGLVVVVSDFRDRAAGSAPLRALAARHEVVCVEVARPARGASCRTRATRAGGPGDRPRTSRSTCRRPGCASVRRGARPSAASALRPTLRRAGAPARRAAHRRRLAARARPGGGDELRSAPLVLLALLVVPLGARAVRRGAPAAPPLRPALPGGRDAGRRAAERRRPGAAGCPPALLALAVAALAVALAQAAAHGRRRRSSRPRSCWSWTRRGSMRRPDVAPTRLDAARERGADASSTRCPSGLQVGLVGYNDRRRTRAAGPDARPRPRHGPTLESLQADGGTATGDALAEALKRLQQRTDAPGAPRAGRDRPALRRQGDGRARPGRGRPPGRAARDPDLHRRARHAGGRRPRRPFGAPFPVPPDPETLRQIAAASTGDAFQVGEAGQLNDVYGSSARSSARAGGARGHRRLRRRGPACCCSAPRRSGRAGARASGERAGRLGRLGGRGARRARGSCPGSPRHGAPRAQEGERHADRRDDEPRGDQEGEVVAGGQRRGGRGAVGDAGVGPGRGSVASRARPSAPPTCAVVLTRPEARPASAGVAPGHRERHERRERQRRRPCRGAPSSGRTSVT